MKKVFSLLAVLAVTVFMASSVWALTSTTVTSVANFSSAGTVEFTFELKNVDGDGTATAINWPISSIPLNVTNTAWTTATTYAVIGATVTKSNGAIYMYQDNKNDQSAYQATSPRVEGDNDIYSGLVNVATHGGSMDIRGYVPMCYQLTTTKTAPSFGTNPEGVTGGRYFIDKGNTNFASQTNYITIANAGGLVGGVTAPSQGGACYNLDGNPMSGYMYFGGLFQKVLGGDTFGTDQIKIVTEIQ